LLREQGHDAVHVGDLGLAAAPDEVILERARAEGRAVVTLDSDYAMLVATAGAESPSVVHIRIEGLNLRRAGELLSTVLPALKDDLEAGCIASVTPRGVRVRRLPT